MSQQHFIYIDESGDLGFDFAHQRTSRYFTMAALVCYGANAHARISYAVKRTLKNKIRWKINELKGSNTSLPMKLHFYQQIVDCPEWEIFSVVVDKKVVNPISKHQSIKTDSRYFYNAVCCALFEKLDYKNMQGHLDIVLDRSTSHEKATALHRSLAQIIRLNSEKNATFSLTHKESCKVTLLQAVDVFCWGIQRKYEHLDEAWYQTFKRKIKTEEICKLKLEDGP